MKIPFRIGNVLYFSSFLLFADNSYAFQSCLNKEDFWNERKGILEKQLEESQIHSLKDLFIGHVESSSMGEFCKDKMKKGIEGYISLPKSINFNQYRQSLYEIQSDFLDFSYYCDNYRILSKSGLLNEIQNMINESNRISCK